MKDLPKVSGQLKSAFLFLNNNFMVEVELFYLIDE